MRIGAELQLLLAAWYSVHFGLALSKLELVHAPRVRYFPPASAIE